MKITALNVENFLGIKSAHVELTKPTTMFAGSNYAGKSSLQEAVRLALIGESVRVSLKKDYLELVHDGAKTGYAQVVMGEQSATVMLPNGKASTEGDYTPSPYLPYLLDAQRFAGMDGKARRSFLYGLMGVKPTSNDIVARMKKVKKLDEKKVDLIAPYLRTGFETTCNEAKTKATTAKGVWKAITGEAYGSVKAVSWVKQLPAAEKTAGAPDAEQRLASIDEQLGEANQNVGTISTILNNQKARTEKMATLAAVGKPEVVRLTGIQVQQELDVERLEKDAKETEAKATGATPVKPLDCPCCQAKLILAETPAKGKKPASQYLIEYVAVDGERDEDAVAALPLKREALFNAQDALEKTQAAIKLAQGHADELERMEAEIPDVAAHTQEDLNEAVQLVSDLKERREAVDLELQAERGAKAAEEAAVKATNDAQAAHTDVVQWTAIADALEPTGIPADLLKEALDPINARLMQSASDAEWPVVVINQDVDITAGGRAYALLSESEQWRVDAMLAEAVAFLSKLKLLVLDRFDVLDGKGREDLLAWLEVLSGNDELETALIFGTLKAAPEATDTMDVQWIEAGTVGELAAA